MKILLISYDNDDYIGHLPLGLGYLAAMLKGHDVEIFCQDVYHNPDWVITQLLDAVKYDVVGVGMCGGYYQYKRLKEISQAINSSRKRPFYVIGGAIASPAPEYFVEKMGADAIVVGEGDYAIRDLVDKMKPGVYEHEVKQLDDLPFPSYSLFPIDHYKKLRRPHADNRDFVLPMVSRRGCPYRCNFCYQPYSFRPRDTKHIIEEMAYLRDYHGVNYNFFADDLLMSSKLRIFKFCEELIESRLGNKWCCSGRLNHASPELLKMMKRAGCVFINYGIESFNDDILEVMHKNLTTDQIVKGVEATLAAGISPGLNLIWGNIGETKKHLQNSVEFLLKYDDGAQIRTIKPVTPYPGTELYKIAVERGLLKDVEDFYEHKHLNSDLISVNFTQYSDDEFHEALSDANRVLLNNYYSKQCHNSVEAMNAMYTKKAEFRGFRRS